MDFWPKRWGGRNFDGDKGLGTVQALGLPFSKQVNGNTTARKIGEFSETVIEEEYPAYYATGIVKLGAAIRIESREAEDYKNVFTRYGRTVYFPVGAEKFVNIGSVFTGTVNDVLTGSGPGIAVQADRYTITTSFYRSRTGRTGIASSYTGHFARYPVQGPGAGDDAPFSADYGILLRETPVGYGDGEQSWFASIFTTWSEALGTDGHGYIIAGLGMQRGNSKDGGVATGIGRPGGAEKCAILPCCVQTIAPDSFVILAACLFTPDPNNAGYQGGDFLLYKTTDRGDTFTVATIPEMKVELPAAPAVDASPPPLRPRSQLICRLNNALLNASKSAAITVLTPDIWLCSYVTYKQVSGNWKNVGQIWRTEDAGSTWSLVAFPALLDESDPPRAARIEHAAYLGQGRVIAKTRDGLLGHDHEWSLIRSDDFGATWTCLPKVGFPESAEHSADTGWFKVLRLRTDTKTSIVTLTVWGGESYDLYESKTDGTDWVKVARLARSDERYSMEVDETILGDESFKQLVYLGTEDEPAPLSIETPWRFDRDTPYEEEA